VDPRGGEGREGGAGFVFSVGDLGERGSGETVEITALLRPPRGLACASTRTAWAARGLSLSAVHGPDDRLVARSVLRRAADRGSKRQEDRAALWTLLGRRRCTGESGRTVTSMSCGDAVWWACYVMDLWRRSGFCCAVREEETLLVRARHVAGWSSLDREVGAILSGAGDGTATCTSTTSWAGLAWTRMHRNQTWYNEQQLFKLNNSINNGQ
jgi:hypothetical protein